MAPRESQDCKKGESRTDLVHPSSQKTTRSASTTPYTRMAMACAILGFWGWSVGVVRVNRQSTIEWGQHTQMHAIKPSPVHTFNTHGRTREAVVDDREDLGHRHRERREHCQRVDRHEEREAEAPPDLVGRDVRPVQVAGPHPHAHDAGPATAAPTPGAADGGGGGGRGASCVSWRMGGWV